MTQTLASSSFSLGGSPEGTLNTMIVLTQKLKHIYQDELNALDSNNLKAFLDLQPSKAQVSRDYELSVKEIQVRSASIKKTDPALRAKVMAEQNELAALAERSQAICSRMAESIKRVRARLIEAARNAVADEQRSNYSSDGKKDCGAAAKPVATAINESV